jgi:hypothetical protein
MEHGAWSMELGASRAKMVEGDRRMETKKEQNI